ncbi:MAG TPA: bifunctional 2-polyprenyl-6-hydroxyphenol methylase/3-demethylubiquinol 3-O-methyltransferase UbiG [Stellaceae bacterium]|nr:bifunctional 2-polyprenyl-6-hydroxyphenol methylase/3-demethylubiquinol 3-O-methyltransferase UbiG [Stellaceae bacterium]
MAQAHDSGGTIDRDEIARFARAAPAWWDPEGEFRPLHRINPVRLHFIRDRLVAQFARDPGALAPFRGLRLLDIGCGGGIVAEPMARLGFAVTGIDADTTALDVARAHARETALAVDYREAAAESLAAAGERFDAVLALEVAEHAQDQALFFAAAAQLVAPGGALIVSTLNRTAKSFALAIVGAEYLLRWIPRGTHRWDRFLRPAEVAAMLRPHGMTLRGIEGLVYQPWRNAWGLGPDVAVNYLLIANKPK